MKLYTFKGTPFLLGTSASDNWYMLSKAERDHWWVHLADIPSAHAIICTDAPPTTEELEYARAIILEQTPKAPTSSRGIIYARVKWVKRATFVGEVTVKQGKARYHV